MGNIDLLEDACAKIPHTTRKMFGGHGLFAPNGGMFAGIVTDDEIVLKLAEEGPRAELIAIGGHPWVYQGKMTMKDWIVVPDAFYDEPRVLAEWAKRAHAIAPGKPVKATRPAKGAKDGKGSKVASPKKAPPPKKATPRKKGAATKDPPAKKKARRAR